jgi:hypothetical protein
MIERRIKAQLRELLDSSPAGALLGPRQVGKTTLALDLTGRRPSIYLDLESDADRARLAEPELYLAEHEDRLVILDANVPYPAPMRDLLLQFATALSCPARREECCNSMSTGGSSFDRSI